MGRSGVGGIYRICNRAEKNRDIPPMQSIIKPLVIAGSTLSAIAMAGFAQVAKNVMTAPRKRVAYTAAQMTTIARLANQNSRPSHAGSPLAGCKAGSERQKGVKRDMGGELHEGTYGSTACTAMAVAYRRR